MDRYRVHDLEPEEESVDRVLATVPSVPPPQGFRDAVMRRIGRRRSAWELVVAAALAVPSAAFLAWIALVHGEDFATGIQSVFTAAQGTQSELFFFVDGLVVLAVALLGLGSALAAHALLRAPAAAR
jgi:hypothetical protein